MPTLQRGELDGMRIGSLQGTKNKGFSLTTTGIRIMVCTATPDLT